MRKIMRMGGIGLLLAVLVWCGSLLADRQRLGEEMVRLHVVANSDSPEDQAVKLKVRDAVVTSLRSAMHDVDNISEAKAVLEENLPLIQEIACDVLRQEGKSCDVTVSLCREGFDTRYYETFALPAGVYDSLHIRIGEGKGENWWCVVFPALCVPATAEGFEDVAAGAGFPEALSGALSGEEGYELRFFLLDALGELENIFFGG